MYASFFGLRGLPFNNTPDPRFFYAAPDHEEALASLIYAVKERKGFVLLTGEVGTGKTLVSRMMLRHFGARVASAQINDAVQNADDLMESVCRELELEIPRGAGRARLVRTLQDCLLAQFACDTPVVLVLDEAQNLPIEVFEQLRLIGSLEADDASLLQIVVVGQPELQRMFASRELRQLRQRIFRSFHLSALKREATGAYIRHRLAVAGAPGGDIFKEDAVDRIHKVSHGLPRVINTVCDNAMLSAYSAGRRMIDGPFLESVARQIMTTEAPPAAPGPDPHVDRLAEALAEVTRRVTELETHVRRALTHDGTLRRSSEYASHREVLDLVNRELRGLDDRVSAKVNDVVRRVSAVERRTNEAPVAGLSMHGNDHATHRLEQQAESLLRLITCG